MVKPRQGDLAGQFKLAQLKVRRRWICVHLKGIVAGPEKAGHLAGKLDDVVHHVRQGDERGQLVHLQQARAEDRSVAGRIVAIVAQQLLISLERITAAKGRECRGVMVGHRVMHAPENRQTIHDAGGMRHVLAHPQAWYAGRNRVENAPDLAWRRGFHVPGIKMTGAAVVEDQDARPDRRFRLGVPAAGFFRCSSLAFGSQEARQRQPQSTDATDAQQATATRISGSLVSKVASRGGSHQ